MQAFQELTIIILIASVVSIFIRYIRQPLIIGYIISGIISGHYVLNVITDTDGMELFAKMGIVILLFTIGLNLNPNTLKEAGKDSFLGGVSQVFISGFLGFVLAFFILSFSLTASIFIGISLALSSTVVVLKILSDKGDIEKPYSKIAVGILLVQDIVSAILLLVLSIFNQNSNPASTSEGSILMMFAIKAVVLILIYMALQKFVLKKLASIFASSQETLLLFGLGAGFMMAFLFYKFGFSLEIGALFAGVALASSHFAKEISSRLKPLQDFFIAMFFVLLGANLYVENIKSMIVPIIIFSLFVIVVNLLVIFLVMNLLGHRTRTAFYIAASLTQVSEFSLIMLALVSVQGYVNKEVVTMMTIVAMITIAISSYMIIYADSFYTKFRNFFKKLEIKKNTSKFMNDNIENFDVVIFGFDRVGHHFLKVFKKLKYKFLVIDINPKYIKRAVTAGAPVIYGDAEDKGFLEENNILKSKMIISTIPNFKVNMYLVEEYKKKNPGGIIISTTHDTHKSKALYEAGANYVIMPYHLGAYHASKMLIDHKKHPGIFEIEKERQMREIHD